MTDAKSLRVKVQIIPERKLSDFEKCILDNTDKKYHAYSYSNMIAVVHDSSICPEWKDSHGSATILTKKDTMVALGFDEATIRHFEQEEEVYSRENQLLAQLEEI